MDIKFVGNYITGTESSIDTVINLSSNLKYSSLVSLSNSATDCLFDQYIISMLTPNSTRTLTTTCPRAGERRTLRILTSGTTSYVLTFGSGFRTTGTLTTGTSNGKRFLVEFTSDGSFLCETSRTVAM